MPRLAPVIEGDLARSSAVVMFVSPGPQSSGPPATYSTWPETNPAASPVKKAMALAMSSGSPDALHGDLGRGGGLEVLEAHADAGGGGGGHVGGDEAGGDGVGGDAELAELDGEGLGEALQTGLGGGVVDLAAVARARSDEDRLTIRPNLASTMYF